MNDGGPAFPHELAAALDKDAAALDSYIELRSADEIKADILALAKYRPLGVSELRDEFAKAALQGLLASANDEVCKAEEECAIEAERIEYANNMARSSYRYADAMIEERTRTEGDA